MEQQPREDDAIGDVLVDVLPDEGDLVRLGVEIEDGTDWMPDGPAEVIASQNLCTLDEVPTRSQDDVQAKQFSIESDGDWLGTLFVSARVLGSADEVASFMKSVSDDPDGSCAEVSTEADGAVILERRELHVMEFIARNERVVFKVRHARNDELDTPQFRDESRDLVEAVAALMAGSIEAALRGDPDSAATSESEALTSAVSEHERIAVTGSDVFRVVPDSAAAFARVGGVFETEAAAAEEAEAVMADYLPPVGIFDVRDDPSNEGLEMSGGGMIEFVGYWVVLGPWDRASEARQACALVLDLTSLDCEVEVTG